MPGYPKLPFDLTSYEQRVRPDAVRSFSESDYVELPGRVHRRGGVISTCVAAECLVVMSLDVPATELAALADNVRVQMSVPG
jgi:hypothetical protein